MESFMWSAIAPVLFAVIGWLFIGFLGKPFLDFQNLKGEVHEAIVYTGNIGGRVEGEVKYGEAAHDNAVDSLRRLAAKVQATYVIASPPLRWFLSVRGYDLVKAGSGLFGLSGSLTSNDGSRAVHRNSIQDALKLSRDRTDDQLRAIQAAWAIKDGIT
jgi:hypothetical protein